MDVVQKAVGLVDTIETESPNGAFEVVLSAATLDRDGEIIDSRAFEPLPDHVPFDIDHDMTVRGTIGSGVPFYDEDGSLRVKGTFASTALAQEVRTLVAEGHIRTTSVTFMAAQRTKDEKGIAHVTAAELLNGTFTPVPSNREAVVLSAKAFDAATTGRVDDVKAVSKAAGIQSAHDTLVSAGAVCAAKSAHEADDSKTVSDTDATEAPASETADETAGATAEAAAPAAKSAAPPAEILARLSITENAARLAFGS